MPRSYERCDVCDLFFPEKKLNMTQVGYVCDGCLDSLETCTVCDAALPSKYLDYVDGELLCVECERALKSKKNEATRKKIACPKCGNRDIEVGIRGEIECDKCTSVKPVKTKDERCDKCGEKSTHKYGDIGHTCEKCDVCKSCGKKPKWMRSNQDLYCDECYNNRFSVCDFCGNESSRKETMYTGSSTLCTKCFSKNFDLEKVGEKLPKGFDHGKLSVVTEKFYRDFFMTREDKMFDLVTKFLLGIVGTKYKRSEIVIDPENYLYFKGEIPVLLSVHVDTIKPAPLEIYESEKTHILVADHGSGIGGDDRAGVIVALLIAFEGKYPHILFTRGEEHGLVGARKIIKDMKAPDVSYILGLDKNGFNDCTYYNNANKEFKKYVATFGLTEVSGTGADIKVLCPGWDISGVNISVGYGEAHTTKDYVSLPALFKAIDTVKKMLKNVPAEKFPFVEKKEEWDIGKTCKHETYKKSKNEEEFKDERGNTYPNTRKLKAIPKDLRSLVFNAMFFLKRIMSHVIFDFVSMMWTFRDTQEDPDMIDVKVMNNAYAFEDYSKEDYKKIVSAIELIVKHSYVWAYDCTSLDDFTSLDDYM